MPQVPIPTLIIKDVKSHKKTGTKEIVPIMMESSVLKLKQEASTKIMNNNIVDNHGHLSLNSFR